MEITHEDGHGKGYRHHQGDEKGEGDLLKFYLFMALEQDGEKDSEVSHRYVNVDIFHIQCLEKRNHQRIEAEAAKITGFFTYFVECKSSYTAIGADEGDKKVKEDAVVAK